MAETPVGDHARYAEQVYDSHHTALRYYFLRHLGDAAAADACVRETLRRFPYPAEGAGDGRQSYERARLMRIAFAVCKERGACAPAPSRDEARAA